MANEANTNDNQLTDMMTFRNKLNQILDRLYDGEDISVTIEIEDVSLTMDIGADIWSSLEQMINVEISDRT